MHAVEDGTLATWESRFARFLDQNADSDAAHDLAHIQRVVANAKKLAHPENADLAVVVPAAWLHDCVTMHKNYEKRAVASEMAARKAGEFLYASGYSPELVPAIQHAIEAHSFTAQVTPRTTEAKVVQDADRLDAIGAIGIARCFTVGGLLGTRLYDPDEPFPEVRPVDDRLNTVDHFYAKLLKLADKMQTTAGKREAARRTAFMEAFLDELRQEIQEL
ncbi:MAG: HD domain-containing protein [Candidatus Promineifilaceae bacterium]|nr:HD domain-containing protein [Candidatus Promineifilaceae bacterium]